MFTHRTRIRLALCLTPLLISASPPGKATSFICSVARAAECGRDLNCGPPSDPGNAPTFFHVNLDGKVITLLGPPHRRGETTQIRSLERDEGKIIMAGIEGGRGWSMVILEADGSMSVTVTDERASFVVFGKCIASELLSP